MPVEKRYLKLAAFILIIVSLLASLALDYYRVQAEAHNKSVEILVDYDELAALARVNNTSLEKMAARFKEAGAVGVVVRERTLKDLAKSGDVVLKSGLEISISQEHDRESFPGIKPVEANTYILFRRSSSFDSVYSFIEVKKNNAVPDKTGPIPVISAFLTEKEIEKMGVGFIQEDLEAMGRGGLSIVPRLRDWGMNSTEGLDLMAQTLEGIPGLDFITFNDTAIAGAGNVPYLAEKLQELALPVGSFEFFEQYGFNTLALLNDKEVVRVHAISENDMTRYNEGEALDRFRLAVSERNIRAIYVRLFGLDHPDTALERGVKFVGDVKQSLENEGFQLGEASIPGGIPYSRIIMVLLGLGVIGAGMLILLLLSPPRWNGLLALLGILGILGWTGLLFLSPLLARKSFALLSVVVFPVLGTVSLVREEKRSLQGAVLALLQMSAISLAGALIMTGLLADKSFMVKVDQFSGVKLSHLLPLLMVPAYFIFREGRIIEKSRELLDYPLKLKHVAAGSLLLAALAVYIIRTGNVGTSLVTTWETKMRFLLDHVLGVRPRTKEFLLGHPAMLLLLYYGYDFRKIALLLLGVVGQISLANTYAHIHTPLFISLTRSFHGMWIGLLMGAVLIVVLNYILKWYTGRFSRG